MQNTKYIWKIGILIAANVFSPLDEQEFEWYSAMHDAEISAEVIYMCGPEESAICAELEREQNEIRQAILTATYERNRIEKEDQRSQLITKKEQIDLAWQQLEKEMTQNMSWWKASCLELIHSAPDEDGWQTLEEMNCTEYSQSEVASLTNYNAKCKQLLFYITETSWAPITSIFFTLYFPTSWFSLFNSMNDALVLDLQKMSISEKAAFIHKLQFQLKSLQEDAQKINNTRDEIYSVLTESLQTEYHDLREYFRNSDNNQGYISKNPNRKTEATMYMAHTGELWLQSKCTSMLQERMSRLMNAIKDDERGEFNQRLDELDRREISATYEKHPIYRLIEQMHMRADYLQDELCFNERYKD